MWHAYERRGMHTGCWWERQKERHLDENVRIILKYILDR
jgi:hypothetical protein